MLQEGIIFGEQESKTYEPLPEDMYQVELVDIEMQEKPNYNDKTKLENVLSFQFVIVEEGEFRGRSIWRNFVPTYLYIGKNGKNALYQITEAMIMRALKDEEKANFGSSYINKLISYQCRVLLKNKPSKDGKVFSNIDSFLPKKEALKSLTEEEKEKARPKKKDTEIKETTNDEIPVVLSSMSEEEVKNMFS